MAVRQSFTLGDFVEIGLSENKKAFGRIVEKYKLMVYEFLSDSGKDSPNIYFLKEQKCLFCIHIFKDVITQGHFKTIGFLKLTTDDLDKIPPSFHQDYFNYKDCSIIYKGIERQAEPDECIGLEKIATWEAETVVERIEDYYAGRRNFEVESFKPILSSDDIRYMPPPGTLKWDAEKRQLYRTDKQ